MDLAVLTAVKVRQEEMFLVLFGKTSARIIRDSRWAGGNVGDRWNNIGRLSFKVRVPEFLLIEGAARIRPFHELVANAPAAVTAFHEINPARLISAVRV